MNTNPSLSLVFVNYRSARYLAKALESLFSFEKGKDNFEVIIVNNDTRETTELEKLKELFPITLIESGENIGFGRGNNRGAKVARGKILGFINPDILWTGAYLQKIEDIFHTTPKIGILGMGILSIDRTEEAWSVGSDPTLVNLFWNNCFPFSRSHWQKTGLSFPDWVSGGALFIRTELFSRISGFDEQFFLYFEDVDLCKRIRNLHFSVVRHEEYSLVHLGGKSKQSTSLQKKQFYVSQKKYFEKHRPWWEVKILGWLQLLFCTL